MNTIFKVGDKVEVLESSTWHEAGPGEVTEVVGKILRVKQSQHYAKGSWISTKYVRPLVEEPAKTELKFEVGARVRGINNHYDHSEGTVTRLEGPFGGDIEIAWDRAARYLSSMTLGALRENLEVTAPAPKPTKKKATLVDDKNKPQIGDTIVAFWEQGPIEFRKKGVVTSIDSEGDYLAGEGYCINWDSELNPRNAPHVYIVERAPKPEPVKVDTFEEAKAPFLAAAVGSKATIANEDSQYIKTGHDEWSLVTSVRIGFPRSTAALLISAEDAKRLTLHVL